MFVMKGKYNIARVMIDNIDDTTKEQIQGFLNHPAFRGEPIVIMPDCHAGMGAVIGFTQPLGDYIIPNVVGVDIGCGMRSAKLGDVTADMINTEDLEAYIRETIPTGFNIHEKPIHNDYAVAQVCETIGINAEKAMRAFGTLGGGNHFIEVGTDETGGVWLTVHTGSRNFGLRVANYYQAKAKERMAKYFISDFAKLEFIHKDDDLAFGYLHDMRVAQNFAEINRELILFGIMEGLGWWAEETVESVHNFIGEDNVIRKGAIQAYEGDRVIIPFNMRDGLIIGVGKGNKDWNNSAPHGAGRIMSRTQARKQISMESYVEAMQGVGGDSVVPETLDEAPQAYKPMSAILDNISPTVGIEYMVKPIFNLKDKTKQRRRGNK